MLDKRLGNLSFTGCGLGRDHQLAVRPNGNSNRGDEPCGCCGATVVSVAGKVCSTCRRQGDEPWHGAEWCSRVKAAIAREPR